MHQTWTADCGGQESLVDAYLCRGGAHLSGELRSELLLPVPVAELVVMAFNGCNGEEREEKECATKEGRGDFPKSDISIVVLIVIPQFNVWD